MEKRCKRTVVDSASANQWRWSAIAAALYLLLVVYGSLLPLDFHPRAIHVAWQQFLSIEYLPLRLHHRADWVANILLYIPLAYLMCVTFSLRCNSGRLTTAGAVFMACSSVAVIIEFLQQFFPPRTMSQNDLIAEFLGTGIGLTAWFISHRGFEDLLVGFRSTGPAAIRAAFALYLLAYTALSLFPYDFFVSYNELAAKLAADTHALVVTTYTCRRLSTCAGTSLGEVVAAIPLGVLFAMLVHRSVARTYLLAFFFGASLGIVIESMQLFMFSPKSEGVSVLTRAIGVAFGVLAQRRMGWLWRQTPHACRIIAVITMVISYMLVLVWANELLAASWPDAHRASRVVATMHWLPFYYYYYMTETDALVNVVTVFAIYAPIGMAFSIWRPQCAHDAVRVRVYAAAGVAALLALAIEAAKLFIVANRPDTANVLVAAIAAAMSYLVLVQLQHCGQRELHTAV